MRAFLAMEIPNDIKEYLQSVIKTAARYLKGVKWVKSEGMHITLKFFGEIGDDTAWHIKDELLHIGTKYSPFSASLKQIDAFPTKGRARVIIVSLENGVDNIKDIFNDIENSIFAMGIEKDERPFVPHITLGRRKMAAPIPKEALTEIEKKSFTVDDFVLFKSTLTSHGAIYTPLWKIKLDKTH